MTEIRFTKTHCLVLCDRGHLVTAHPLKNWAGSQFAADVAFRHKGDRFDRLSEKCQGFGHDEIIRIDPV